MNVAVVWAAMSAALTGISKADDVAVGVRDLADMANLSTVDLGPSGALHYYIGRLPSGAAPDPDSIVSALIVIHGYPRDANRTLGAAVLAARKAGRDTNTVMIAPLFQVADSEAQRCSFHGNPVAQKGDALWTCSSWIAGGRAEGGGATSFEAIDALTASLAKSWPRLRAITIAGFSAGAQFVQHSIGFARPPKGVRLRYVVADPGTWLYFDAYRPMPLVDGQPSAWTRCRDVSSCSFAWLPLDARMAATCPDANRWKYGTDGLPDAFGVGANEARARYAAADVAYLEGALDTGDGRGTFFRLLDKSCAADLQGPYRLQRGLAYSAYSQRFLSANRPMAVVPLCAHEVTCVFPSDAARPLLFPE